MTRPLRYIEPECLYHVTARGNRKGDIVLDDEDRLTVVELLARVVCDRRWLLHAWVLMTNHLHLVVTTPLANLSEGMRDFLGEYSRRFNSVHGLVGHLFQHRFDAKPVERETHLLELVRYVPLNPVRARMVGSPADWPWSSYLATAGFQPVPEWLEVDSTLAQFNPKDRRLAQRKFREFVNRPRDVEYDPHSATINGWIIGSQEFCERIQKWIDARSPSIEHPDRQRHVIRCDFDELLSIVKRDLRLTELDLRRRTEGPARKLIADLGHDECGVSFGQIASSLGISPQAAAKLRARSRELSLREPDYAELLSRIRASLRQPIKSGVKLLLQT
ncbi:MAG TPA: transposase [Thermoanaerobaculia bacterium]|nr:transposase [Thermoanaerobaculia bacterium]